MSDLSADLTELSPPQTAFVVPSPFVPDGAGWALMWRVELQKLAGQARVKVAFALCLLGPVVFVVAMAVQPAVPADTLFGRWVHESGWAEALVVLGFSSQWGLPVLISVVAGDLCSEEDRLGTWPLLLTRSRTRAEIVAGKLLAGATYAVVVTLMLGLVATVAGVVAVGTQPLVGLSGSLVGSNRAFYVVVLAWLSVLPPTVAIAAIALAASAVSRNSWVGVIVPVVVVLLCTLLGLLSAIDPVRAFLPTTGYEAWYGLARTDSYTGPIWTSLAVSAGWVLVGAGMTVLVMMRRDVSAQ
ncbi:MAG TPA: ABC transporter permease [Acidimicrobiales bacterium]|jgi:ABC-2 type transport system permease protein|nr:ABC transporter permease [Acidimicrobiales bacterium]